MNSHAENKQINLIEHAGINRNYTVYVTKKHQYFVAKWEALTYNSSTLLLLLIVLVLRHLISKLYYSF